jgi:two-component system OmpR family sensor kinase/two-component system sensor histidine kinase BaeS
MSPRPPWQEKPQDGEDQEIEIPLEVRGRTPHWQGHSWQEYHGQRAWSREEWRRTRQRRGMFARMVGVLLLIVLLGAGAMAVASHIITTVNGTHDSLPIFFFWRFCGIALLVPLLIMFIGSRIYRAYAVPLADIMDAAEAVATGNLQVRVTERGSREFQRLASSFNRMTGELERIDQQRRNLTADVAHELRTPLHIIQGNLEGILDGVYAPTPEHIEATLQETRTLARLVDDLRTLSLAESGQLPLHPETVDIHDLLADVATSFSPQVESAGIELCVEAEESVPMALYGDPGRLDQVLSNLVSNALRHTPSNGRITLGAALLQPGEPVDGESEQIQLTVTDTGEGIAAEDLPFIFDRFWRGDRARTHKEGAGSGLGLAIAGQLVKAHGGTITVASTPGSGTTFTITLPVAMNDAKSVN